MIIRVTRVETKCKEDKMIISSKNAGKVSEDKFPCFFAERI